MKHSALAAAIGLLAMPAAAHLMFNEPTESAEALEAKLVDLNKQSNRIQARATVENRELSDAENDQIRAIFAEFELVEAKLSMLSEPGQRRTEPDRIRSVASSETRGSLPLAGLTSHGGLLPQNQGDPLRYIFGNQTSNESRFSGSTFDFLAYCRNPALQAQNATATEGVGIDGGFAVPSTLHQQVMTELMETSEFWRRCRLYPAAANNVTIALPDVLNQLEKLAGYKVDWVAENSSTAGQILKWRTVDLKLGKLMAMAEASSELEEDAPGYARMVEMTLGADAGMRLDHALIAGNGVGTPLGYLNADSVIEVNAESGQAADSITWQNIVDMYGRVHPACKRRAVWVVTSEAMPQLMMMNLPNGNPALLTGGTNDGGAGALSPRMLGLPIIESTLAPMLGDRGDIALVDFSQVALIMRNASRIDYSQHINFNRDVVNWRLRWRVSATPIWDKVFSPRNGGMSLSWATVLGARD